jgi:pimeloyl-ACP methyl ester carboxylesterase
MELEYLVSGEGPPQALLVHGACCKASVWRGVMEALWARHRVASVAEDFMVARASVEMTAKSYGTEAVLIPRCGHMLPLEAPEAVARLVAGAG